MQPSPDRIVVLHSRDAPGYVDLRADAADGAQLATTFRSGGPGAATLGADELSIGAPAPCPGGCHRFISGADGSVQCYLEYRGQLSPGGSTIDLVADDDRGLLASVRDRSGARSALWHLRLARAVPSMAVVIGHEERGSIDPVDGGHALTWHGPERLSRRDSLLLALAPVLGVRA